MSLIPTRVHAGLDYAAGTLLIASPWMFGFADHSSQTWTPIAVGLGLLLYSVFTDYELGAMRVVSVPTHLLLDAGSGLALVISPWLFDFSVWVWKPHVLMGALLMIAAVMTERLPSWVDARHA